VTFSGIGSQATQPVENRRKTYAPMNAPNRTTSDARNIQTPVLTLPTPPNGQLSPNGPLGPWNRSRAIATSVARTPSRPTPVDAA